MRLADFITTTTEPNLADRVAFPTTSGAAGRATDLAGPRDHAAEMRTQVAAGSVARYARDVEQSKELYTLVLVAVRGEAGDVVLDVHGAERIVTAQRSTSAVRASADAGTRCTVRPPRTPVAPT